MIYRSLTWLWRLPWERTTPLGGPVVPLVYSTMAASWWLLFDCIPFVLIIDILNPYCPNNYSALLQISKLPHLEPPPQLTSVVSTSGLYSPSLTSPTSPTSLTSTPRSST